jgi:hypothetical protein
VEEQRPTVGLGSQTVEAFGQPGSQAAGEQAAFEGGDAEERLLGEELPGADGLIKGDEVGLEVGDGAGYFAVDDAKGGGGEAVLAGVLGRVSLALGRARAGGAGGVRRP